MTDALIPARGGSKRLRRKNLLELGDGVSLLANAIFTCRRYVDGTIYVSTEDPEIRNQALLLGATVLDRPPALATDTATVDAVVQDFIDTYGCDDGLLVYQPTVILADTGHIGDMMDSTFVGGVALAVPTHGIWDSQSSMVHERLNAQDLPIGPYKEIGVRYYLETKDPRPEKVYLVLEAIDIDTPADLVAARQFVNRRPILFRIRYDGSTGSGHYHRTMQLALALQHHQIFFEVQGSAPPYMPFETVDPYMITDNWHPFINPPLIVNDRLDTSEHEMVELRYHFPESRIINFEDHGTGARYADAVVNALYPAKLPGEHVGHRYAVLRSEFRSVLRSDVKEHPYIGVTFGGTDPSGLTQRLSQLLHHPDIRYVVPPGLAKDETYFGPLWEGSMAKLFSKSRFVITSAGRTLYEAAYMGVPALVIAANAREATHVHLGPEHGNVYLGIGQTLHDDTIVNAFERFLKEDDLLKQLAWQARRSIDGFGAERVLNLIEGQLIE